MRGKMKTFNHHSEHSFVLNPSTKYPEECEHRFIYDPVLNDSFCRHCKSSSNALIFMKYGYDYTNEDKRKINSIVKKQ